MSLRQTCLVTASLTISLTLVSCGNAFAQQPQSFRTVEKTVYDKTPVKSSKWIEETVYEKQQVTEYKRVWETEKRERVTKVLKPVVTQTERVERKTVLKPVIETKYREKETKETIFETVTEMRDRDYIVETPVVETEMREEKVVVKRPVLEKMMRNDHVTTYRPVVIEQEQLVPANLQFNEFVNVANLNARPRLQWLRPGYYTDPATGKSVYRHRGMHWVKQPQTSLVLKSNNVPVIATQKTQQIQYVPETTTQSTPVEVTQMVETVERRKVPVTVKRTERRIETRKVPVTVERPKTVIRTERIPYEETRFVEETMERRVPVTETRYETVERVEPYEVSVQKWVAVTKEVEVPKTVRREVEVDLIRHTPRRVTVKVPVDEFGSEIDAPAQSTSETSSSGNSKSEWKTVTPTPADKNLSETSSRSPNSVLETPGSDSKADASPAAESKPAAPSGLNEYHAYPTLRRLGDRQVKTDASDYSTAQSKLQPIWRPNEQIETSTEQPTAQIDELDIPASSAPKPSRTGEEVELNDATADPIQKSPAPTNSPGTDGAPELDAPIE